MDNLPVTLTLTVGNVNFLLSKLQKFPYEEVLGTIAYLQGEAQKAIDAEQARLAAEPAIPEATIAEAA